MKSLFFRKVARRLRGLFGRSPDAFLRGMTGVIHVGANFGQERALYDKYGLNVLWIEPIPDVYEVLKLNLQEYPRQRAVKALVTNEDDVEHDFRIASNEGASSSIFDLKRHSDIWPDVTHKTTISLRSTTLASLVQSNEVDMRAYDALVIDTQGAELLVLDGALPILDAFRFIKLEAADFEAYEGCCQLRDIQLFMHQNGFREELRRAFAEHPDGGTYYDLVYQRRI